MVKSLSEYLVEKLNEDKVADLEKKLEKVEKKADDAQDAADDAQDTADDAEKEASKGEESIKDEKTFKDYAKNKFKEVFGDDLDEDQMNETIEGLLEDNKDLVEAGEWGELVGMLNKSFGK